MATGVPTLTDAAATETAAATSDEILMRRYANGDAAAFDILYARHKDSLYRYLVRGCSDRAVAGELFQDVWMRVIRARRRYKPKARFNVWLYTIAHNRLVDHYRRHRSSETVPDLAAPTADEPPSQTERTQRAERLRAALNQLPFEQREAILLKEEQDLSLKEIAAVTGARAETVKSRLRYALAKLRKELPDDPT